VTDQSTISVQPNAELEKHLKTKDKMFASLEAKNWKEEAHNFVKALDPY